MMTTFALSRPGPPSETRPRRAVLRELIQLGQGFVPTPVEVLKEGAPKGEGYCRGLSTIQLPISF